MMALATRYEVSAQAASSVLTERLPAMCGSETLTTVVSRDRKSTRLNSSHRCISYAVFCLKKISEAIRIRGYLPSFVLFLCTIVECDVAYREPRLSHSCCYSTRSTHPAEKVDN